MPRWRLIPLAVLIIVAAGFVLAPSGHDWLLSLFSAAERVIQQQPGVGMLVFVILAALSAMLAFVSSAILVPVAVHVWGPALCFVLLWAGWLLGGLAGYAIGRYLGRPAVEALVRPGVLARHEAWARSGQSLVPILTLQLAIPSDMASYLFGLVRCRFIPFLVALALAEIPYALGAVYLGRSFLERRLIPLLMVGAVIILLSAWALRRLHRHDRAIIRPRPSVPTSV